MVPSGTPAPGIRTLVVAAIVLTFTPGLLSFWTNSILLVLLARRRGWARWLLVAGVGIRATLILLSDYPPNGAPQLRADSRTIDLDYLFLGISVVATILMFSPTASGWFSRRIARTDAASA